MTYELRKADLITNLYFTLSTFIYTTKDNRTSLAIIRPKLILRYDSCLSQSSDSLAQRPGL